MPIAYQDEPQAVPWLAKHDLAYYGPFRYAPTPLVVTSAGSNREKGSTLEKWRANRPAPPPPQGSFRPRAVRPRGTHRRGIAAPFLPFRLARPRTPPGWTAPPTWWAHRISGREIPLSHWRAFPGSGASSLPLFSPCLFLSRRSSPCPFISPVPTRPTRSSSFVPTLFPRDNVRAFVKNETEADDYYVEGGILGHTVVLGTGTANEVKLRVYEETMLESTRVHCDCCRCIGWHHHPVTRKQYHFIIHTDFRTDAKPELKGKRICQLCTAAMPANLKVCPSCQENDSETSMLDYQTHLMHGMLHANGCGHLMRINGREAGSRTLSGQQLIQVWEKICELLRVREVSVEDVSQKYGVEFRLLNPVACGKTWYGTYGYQFGKGSFGNTAATHRRAAERLRAFQLDDVKSDYKNMMKGAAWDRDEADEEALAVIARYEVLMTPKFAPKTIGGLVALLLRLQRVVRRNDKAEKELVLREQQKAKSGEVKNAGGRRDAAGETSGAGRAARRREEEREAAAKRKAASSFFEPLKFESKAAKASKLSQRGGGPGRAAASAGPTRVISTAKPRATPKRPLRPRGADGLVPSNAPMPAPAPVVKAPPPVKREPLRPAVKAEVARPTPSTPPPAKKSKSTAPPPSPVNLSRWSDARIETASNACVEVLREAAGKWMPRQEVRAAAREKGVGDTGLLDHVLKNISERKVVLTKADNKNSIAGKGTRYPAPRLVSLFVPRARRHVGAEDT